ncbi:hypothetical protein EJ04DRAFT_577241 [Polyplosphaeria fusca]|uniref:BRCT domain-containing protein n=1 Tax=Polyplosphaeria fusca TaxID=682080 RepID=A0A9P4QZU0_9PLEO|nr:hypothetical protein EJ04DRAFT_577241 [Polyplosphaeria fusca]
MWILVRRNAGLELSRHSLSDGPNYLVTDTSNEATSFVCTNDDNDEVRAAGRIDLLNNAAKLEALGEDILVQPAPSSQTAGSQTPKHGPYKLKKRGSPPSEILFLREADTIILLDCYFALRFIWDPTEVQVRSSVAVEPVEQQQQQQEHAEEETEDEEDRENTMVATMQPKPSSRGTPLASAAHSEVVQETPAAGRVADPMDMDPSIDTTHPEFSTAHSRKKVEEEEDSNATGETSTLGQTVSQNNSSTACPKSSEEEDNDDEEEQSTPASTTPQKKGRVKTIAAKTASPEPVRRGRPKKTPRTLKRASPAEINEDGEEQEHATRSAKRLKRNDSSPELGTPTTRASQNSSLGLLAVSNPGVAFSNSSITDDSNFMKFLRTHGGTKVTDIKKGACHILCVRSSGLLRKSTKLLACVALGIPIVTDKWLQDSARSGKFLALDPYMPDVPDQEEEWSFSMQKIWNTKQDALFEGKTIYFSPQLKKLYSPFSEVETVCKAAGARRIVSKPAKEVKEKEKDDLVILALDEGDVDMAALTERGFTCFSKDFLTLSILRGDVDLDSPEFKIGHVASQPKKRGRPKKG